MGSRGGGGGGGGGGVEAASEEMGRWSWMRDGDAIAGEGEAGVIAAAALSLSSSTSAAGGGGGGGAAAAAAAAAGEEDDGRALRVDQLDAGVLDQELQGLLRLQLRRCLAKLPPSWHAGDRLGPEMEAGLGVLLFLFSVWSHRPTPGMRLENLNYRVTRRDGSGGVVLELPSAWRRLAWGGLCVVGPWILTRGRAYMLVNGWGDERSEGSPDQQFPQQEGSSGRTGRRRWWKWTAWRSLKTIEGALRIVWLVNTLAFLRSGTYPTPWDRLLGMRMVYASPAAAGAHQINYAFLNRRLLWDAFVPAIASVSSLVDWVALRRRLLLLAHYCVGGRGGGGGGGGGGGSTGEQRRRRRIMIREESDESRSALRASAAVTEPCSHCGQSPPTMAHVASCGDMFCYYCIKSQCMRNENYKCPRCGELFESAERL